MYETRDSINDARFLISWFDVFLSGYQRAAGGQSALEKKNHHRVPATGLGAVRADCLATNTEYCDRCTHAATQATNVARIKTEGTKGLLQGQVAG
jgi:hypothetical protein